MSRSRSICGRLVLTVGLLAAASSCGDDAASSDGPGAVEQALADLSDAGLDCATVGETSQTTQWIVTAYSTDCRLTDPPGPVGLTLWTFDDPDDRSDFARNRYSWGQEAESTAESRYVIGETWVVSSNTAYVLEQLERNADATPYP